MTLEKLWKQFGQGSPVRVRFNDWSYQIKYFTIFELSKDRKFFTGELDNGEKMSFSKNSLGWSLYYPDDEFQAKAV